MKKVSGFCVKMFVVRLAGVSSTIACHVCIVCLYNSFLRHDLASHGRDLAEGETMSGSNHFFFITSYVFLLWPTAI